MLKEYHSANTFSLGRSMNSQEEQVEDEIQRERSEVEERRQHAPWLQTHLHELPTSNRTKLTGTCLYVSKCRLE
jgi:hypothetical protein